MQRYEEKVIIRELKAVLGRAAGMLCLAGLSDYEICRIVEASTRLATEEMETHAQVAKHQGGN